MTDGPSPVEVGAELELDVGPVAHGGHCVARHDGPGRLRPAHPAGGAGPGTWSPRGPRSSCGPTPSRSSTAAAGRVAAPCPHARPGGCGGCDWQHADLPTQRGAEGGGRRPSSSVAWPASTAMSWSRSCPVRPDGLQLAHPRAVLGRPGHRAPGPAPAPVERRGGPRRLPARPPRCARDRGPRPRLDRRRGRPGRSLADHGRRGRRRRRRRPGCPPGPRARGRPGVAGRRGRLLAGAPRGRGHPDGRRSSRRSPRGRGSTRSTSTRVPASTRRPWPTPSGSPGGSTPSRGPARAVRDARRNLHDLSVGAPARGRRRLAGSRPEASAAATSSCSTRRARAPGATSCAAIVRLAPRAVAYVACDPAALARDVKTFAGLGWELAALRAFDLFPMTHHVECVATLRPLADAGRHGDILISR